MQKKNKKKLPLEGLRSYKQLLAMLCTFSMIVQNYVIHVKRPQFLRTVQTLCETGSFV